MSEVFESYERQYCELSANLSKKCTSASLVDGGKMTQLSFGKNPFAKRVPTSTTRAETFRPLTILPNCSTTPRTEKNDRGKRKEVDEVPKGPNKKNKAGATEDEPPLQLVSATFGSLAATHYSDDDAKLFMKRDSSDAEFAFKMGLGGAFYHGLNILSKKNKIIHDQEKTVKKWKGEASSLKTQLLDTQKKIDEESKARKDELEKLQGEFNKLAVDSKATGEALKKENEKLHKELDKLKEGMDKELSDAYNLGFLGCLQNFLAADPDYDWSKHFAPSTSGYMITFKANNAKAIEEAKEDLRKKIESELLEIKATEEAKKDNVDGGNEVGENVQNVSPSETTAVWLYELSIIANTFGVRALH